MTGQNAQATWKLGAAAFQMVSHFLRQVFIQAPWIQGVDQPRE
jgi:hypothetical protein